MWIDDELYRKFVLLRYRQSDYIIIAIICDALEQSSVILRIAYEIANVYHSVLC